MIPQAARRISVVYRPQSIKETILVIQRSRLETDGVCQLTAWYIICLKTRGTFSLSIESQRDLRFSGRYMGCSAIVNSDGFFQPYDEGIKDYLKRWHMCTILQDVTSQKKKKNRSPSNFPFGTRRFIDACHWNNPWYRAIHSLGSSSIIYPSAPSSEPSSLFIHLSPRFIL